MFQIPFKKSKLQSISEENWAKIAPLVAKPTVVNVWGSHLPGDILLPLGIMLHEQGLGLLRWHTYHCEYEPVEIRKFEDGFSADECKICKTKLNDDNTSYELELIIKYPIVLE